MVGQTIALRGLSRRAEVRLVSVLPHDFVGGVHGFGQHVKEGAGAHRTEDHAAAVFIGLDAVIHIGRAENLFQPQGVLQLLADVDQHRLFIFEVGCVLLHFHQCKLMSICWFVPLSVLVLFGYLIPSTRGENWGGTGGTGGAMSATLVSSIPLPVPPTQTQNVLANESKGLTQSPPKEIPKEEPKAIPIPAPEAKKKGPRESAQKKLPPKEMARVEDNRIPFGQGGPVSGPYGSFAAGGAKGGLSFTGGNGDFGSRFGWYVDGVRRKVSENWLKYEVDPNIDEIGRASC